MSKENNIDKAFRLFTDTGYKEYLESLVDQAQMIAYKTCIKLNIIHYVKEENLPSIGNLGLTRALNWYKPDKGCKFSTILIKSIRQICFREIQKTEKVYGNSEVYDKDSPVMFLALGVKEDEKKSLLYNDIKNLKHFDDTEKEMLILLSKGYKPIEVEQLMNLDKGYVAKKMYYLRHKKTEKCKEIFKVLI